MASSTVMQDSAEVPLPGFVETATPATVALSPLLTAFGPGNGSLRPHW